MVDKRRRRQFQVWVTPRDFPELRFLAPTRSLGVEMSSGPDREPETREWIEQIDPISDPVLWDIGANVGSFTVLAAKRGIRVVAVEPMPQNLYLLTSNIVENRVAERCTVLPLAVSGDTGPNSFWLTSDDFGSARHAFGLPIRDGQELNTVMSFNIVGVTIDDAVASLGLPAPTHLKIDVDGIDDEIIYGADESLTKIEGICCEVKFSQTRIDDLTRFLKARSFQIVEVGPRNAIFRRVS